MPPITTSWMSIKHNTIKQKIKGGRYDKWTSKTKWRQTWGGNRSLRWAIEDGYIHIKFTQTRSGTELGINVDLNSTNVKDLDFTIGQGLLHIEGTTNLNYNAVRLIVDIDLAS